jgi:hypothetical protein
MKNNQNATKSDADFVSLCELAALYAVKCFVLSCEETKHVFELKELEAIYLESLKEAGIDRESHTSRFAHLASTHDCGIVPLQKRISNEALGH